MIERLWTCPRCGNRFVTKDAWHSCGRFELTTLFAASEPATIELARRYIGMLEGLGDVEVIIQRTRLTALARVRFAGAVPRTRGFLANFALRRRIDHDRVTKVDRHGASWWTHHVRVFDVEDLDDELRDWLQASHDTVGLQRS